MNPVQVQEVTFRYRTGQGVENLSFHVPPGEFLGIVGPNSAGKSTILRVLSKVVIPGRGRVLIEGQDLASLPRIALARKVAVVPQEFQVAFPFRVGEVVLMGRYPHAAGGTWARRRDRFVARSAMEATGIADLASRRIDELSGGERQLVSIARALAQEASILLLDEPTAHLDLKHQLAILEVLFTHHRAKQGTTIVVSHDLNLAAEHCDRILLLARGRIRALGTPEEVINPAHLEAAYGCPVDVAADPVSGRPRVQGSPSRWASNGASLPPPSGRKGSW